MNGDYLAWESFEHVQRAPGARMPFAFTFGVVPQQPVYLSSVSLPKQILLFSVIIPRDTTAHFRPLGRYIFGFIRWYWRKRNNVYIITDFGAPEECSIFILTDLH